MSDTRRLDARLRGILTILYRRARARRSAERRQMLDYFEDLTDGLDDAERHAAIAAAGDEGLDPDDEG